MEQMEVRLIPFNARLTNVIPSGRAAFDYSRAHDETRMLKDTQRHGARDREKGY